MSDKSDAPRRAPTVFVIPEEAHFELVKLCEHARMMARVVNPGTSAFEDCPRHPRALCWSYTTIWRALKEYLEATYWSADHALDIEEAHKRAAEIRERNSALCGIDTQ